MNRRSFLSLLAGAGAATATSYFFAPIGGWKSDVIVQPDSIREEWIERLRYYEQYAQQHPPYFDKIDYPFWATDDRGVEELIYWKPIPISNAMRYGLRGRRL